MRILVPVDGSQAALRAVKHAAALAGAERLIKRAKIAHQAHVMYGEAGETIANAARSSSKASHLPPGSSSWRRGDARARRRAPH